MRNEAEKTPVWGLGRVDIETRSNSRGKKGKGKMKERGGGVEREERRWGGALGAEGEKKFKPRERKRESHRSTC